jgi:hypothetical protein
MAGGVGWAGRLFRLRGSAPPTDTPPRLAMGRVFWRSHALRPIGVPARGLRQL